jgi:hypothetical protein
MLFADGLIHEITNVAATNLRQSSGPTDNTVGQRRSVDQHLRKETSNPFVFLTFLPAASTVFKPSVMGTLQG